MLQLKNTNLTLKGGETLLHFTTEKNGFGDRFIVICPNEKDKQILKKYLKLGFYQSLSTFFDGSNFYLLTKGLKQSTKNGKYIVIDNELHHINKHIERGNIIKTEN